MDHLEDWERYLATQDRDGIAQTAIVHAQFELIHPFKDGSNRLAPPVLSPLADGVT
ncbi:Fic family protein [Candidatus Thiodictyon syntrophicum]|uniref:Fic family protein n=1 Tax=Candidatus Thiodictyon syntrophicum TaxID=1166950 RepID=UPI0012FE154B